MAPHPSVPAGHARVSNPSTSNGYGYAQLSKVFLLVLVVATAIRLALISFMARKRRTVQSYQQSSIQEKDRKSCQAPSEKDLRQHRILDSKGQSPPTIRPIYPWTGPPQPLPGPYDPRLYPLPTIRRHSYDPSTIGPEETSTISYERRVSTNSIPSQQALLRGTMMSSSKGWRRNQWVISGE